MEIPWPFERCILCLKQRPLTRSHVVSGSIGGFLWARTQCATCNSVLGARVEATLKKDAAIRHALEVKLAEELPDLARRFAERQTYAGRSTIGNLQASFRGGSVALGTTRMADSLVLGRERARTAIDASLQRSGYSAEERLAALERFDAAPAGTITTLADGIAIRHGAVDRFVIPYDGPPVPDHLPLAIAFHMLALCLGNVIYHQVFDRIRTAIMEQRHDADQFAVEALMDRRTGYAPLHVVGLSASSPHLIMRVQLFGLLVWRVHFHRARADSVAPMGLALDLKTRTAVPAEPESSLG